jgi:hypothetical protein
VNFRSCLLAAAATGLLPAIVLPRADAAPLKVGSGNEAVIEPAVIHPDETPCVVKLLTKAPFANFNPANYSFTPPAACPGPWAKVVLSISISLNEGRQFDRSGLLFLGGVPIWFGTTAEPRATLAPYWSFEKDVTDYTALFESAQTGYMEIGNIVNSTYTSTITASATLKFYPVTPTAPAPVTADMVVPVPTGGGLATLNTGADQLSLTATLPTNILRASLQLYLQGQSSDEFWYFCVPNAYSGELESCGGTAYREGEITVDGVPAGVAPVYPWIFTGGIDPYLWQPIPGVQTFDFTPFHADLSPFAGVLSNGQPHTIATSVYNADGYFSATGALLLFLDKNATTVTGSITRNTLKAPAPAIDAKIAMNNGIATGSIATTSKRSFTISGTVTGSAGTTLNSITETSVFSNVQHFGVSGTEDLQTVDQTTDTTITTSSTGGGSSAKQTVTLHYPLNIYYDFVTGKSGNSTQLTRVNLQYQGSDLQELAGSPISQGLLTDAIKAQDTLFFNSQFSVTGHKSQSETATYTRTGTGAPCFKRTLVSTFNVLSTVQTGC